MARINKSMLLVYAFTVFVFVVFFFVTNQQTPKDEVMSYLKEMETQKHVMLQRLMEIEKSQKKQEEATTTQDIRMTKKEDHKKENLSSAIIIKKEDKETQKEMINFMKYVQQQIASMDTAIRGLPRWNEYEDLNRKLRETFHRSPFKKRLPARNVTYDDITLDCKLEYDVIILVTSYAGHFERRAWIRDSWGASNTWLTKKNWKVIFNVGSVSKDATIMNRLKNESMHFKDVLGLDVPENFHKLSEKVMVALKWVYQNAKFNFILKTDDDIFIHVDLVIAKLAGDWSHEHFIGNVMAGVAPIRTKGRYQVSKEEWPGEVYDPYCSGGGFFLSKVIIGKMVHHFNLVNPLKIDDAYIGHLVHLAGGRPLSAPEHILMYNDNCRYNDKFLISHPVKKAVYRDFLMSKALIEMGKVEKRGHKYENVTFLFNLRKD